MVYFSEDEIDRLILEDVGYFDLTTSILDIQGEIGIISFSPRHKIILCGTEEVARIFNKFNIFIDLIKSSGTEVEEGETFLVGKGRVENLHKIWKVTQNFLEYACGIATRTRNLVDLAKRYNPNILVVTTRKHFPFGKKVSIKAILTGGAMPHRLGLSETILIFEEHLNFYGGYKSFFDSLKEIKKRVTEKKIVLEVKTIDTAYMAIKSGIDILQLDKFNVDDVKKVVDLVKSSGKNIKIAVAGGINEKNIEFYAQTGIDIIVLSCAYFGKPADIKVNLVPER